MALTFPAELCAASAENCSLWFQNYARVGTFFMPARCGDYGFGDVKFDKLKRIWADGLAQISRHLQVYPNFPTLTFQLPNSST
jgi:hypothetical protein